jgi:hypothetical protein
MQMKTIYSKIMMWALLVGVVTSCSTVGDIEELEPYYQFTEGTAYSTGDKVEQALNGIHAGWRSWGSAVGGASNAWKMAGLYEAFYFKHDQMTDLDFQYDGRPWINNIGTRYDQMYKIISRSNYLIKNLKDKKEGDIPNLTEQRRIEAIGIAHISRALAHFDLLCYFGQHYDLNSEYGIAIVEEVIQGSEGPARSSVAQSYESVIKDLEYGMQNAPDEIDGNRFTRSSAKAFLARVLLFKKDYAGAAKHASEFIATYKDSGYILESVYGDVFRNGYNSKEFIFCPYAFKYSESSYAWGPSWDPVTDMFKKIVDEQVGAADDGNDVSGEGYDPRYSYAHAIDSLKNGLRCMKYPQPEDFDVPDNSNYVMRLAELYLIYAEAKTRETNAVDQTAIDMLNTISERAGYGANRHNPTTVAEMLNLVRIEKLCELWAEWGTEYHDMVRYHFHGDIDIKVLRPVVKNEWQLTYPLTKEVLFGNPNLVQNPGYPDER